MSRRNYIHTMDALVHGYSNLVTAPSFGQEPMALPDAPMVLVESEADKAERLNAQTARETAGAQMQAQIRDSRIATAKIEADRLAKIEAEKQANAPIIVVPTPYSPPPLIIGGGGGGGGSMGGGEARKPLSGSTTVAKPSFLKKNFIPLLLVTGAIFVFIKKPIK